MPVTQTLTELRQEDCCGFELSLNYIVRLYPNLLYPPTKRNI